MTEKFIEIQDRLNELLTYFNIKGNEPTQQDFNELNYIKNQLESLEKLMTM